MNRLLSIISIIFLTAFSTSAQVDSLDNRVIELAEVLIEAENLWLIDDLPSTKSLKTTINNNIASRIDAVSPLHVRAHSLLLLSVASGLGGQSGHLGLNWEGFNLQNIQNGVVDLSLIPVWQFERADLHLGGSSVNFGSGALSGGIALSNDHSLTESQIKLLVGTGSFGSIKTGAMVNLNTEKISTSTSFFRESAKNNFSFSHPTIDGFVQVENGNAWLNSIVQTTKFRLNQKSSIGVDLWYLKSDREIPESLIDFDSKGRQNDEQLRAAVNYTLIGNNSVLSIKTSFLNDYIRYRDERWGIDSKNESSQYQTRADYKKSLGGHSILKAGIQINRAKSKAADYEKGDDWHLENRFAAYLSSDLKLSKSLLIRPTMRSKKFREESPTIEPALTVEYSTNPNLRISLRANRNYKFPTSNDLYWFDPIFNSFGNPDLKTEKSNNAELGFYYLGSKSKLSAYLRTFLNEIDNQIIWMPIDSVSWSPVNANRSKGKGASAGVTYKISDGKVKNVISVDFHYLKSELFSKNGINGNEGSPLPYSPEFKTAASYTIQAWNFSFQANGIWVDERFSGFGTLESYALLNTSISYEAILLDRKAHLGFEVVNLFDERYQIIQDRIVPGRMLNFSLEIQLLNSSGKL